MKLQGTIPFAELDRALGRTAASAGDWTQRLADLCAAPDRLDTDERAALAAAIERGLAEIGPHVAALDAVRTLARPGTGVVLATCEPGFLASPLAAIWSALSAIRLARSLAAATETPCVPVLWVSADAHAKRRLHPARIRNEYDDLRKVGLAGVVDDAQPTGRIVLTEECHRIGAAGALLAQTLARAPETERALAACLPRDRETWARAFSRAVLELLGPLGLVVIEPDWLRGDLSHALADILSPPGPSGPVPLAELWRGGGGREDAALVYRFDERGRVPLRLGGEGLCYDDEPGSRTARELAAEIVQAPERWCASEALLPLVLERCLPVAACVGTPAERAGARALDGLARHLGWARAPWVRRFEATLIEPAVQDSLGKAGLEPAEALFAGPALVERESPADPEVVRRLDELAAGAAAELGAIARSLAPEERVLERRLRRAGRRLRDELGEVRERARRLHANRSGKSRRHLRRVACALRPEGRLQEEVLGPLPFAAGWGLDVFAGVLEHVGAIPDGHVLVGLEP